jgi:hypothetical protein
MTRRSTQAPHRNIVVARSAGSALGAWVSDLTKAVVNANISCVIFFIVCFSYRPIDDSRFQQLLRRVRLHRDSVVMISSHSSRMFPIVSCFSTV